ncbi:MAG: hypothetical protein HN742_07720 [Lentisphaerae bacterium]|jgi:hypothetical protein|nr:hypothetical protein [Lentisphaerota bacterium]MBT4818879.1 hypothetical protein [Lentisphaerota bacterium]MBT5608625.1 hypothetical protein [Lentisphaerota bacterium]MBT7055856.1 hypothetical protein [Lentisphaerota bacterium]MBT7841744.1 hypothetical protein [Lentisphaerota bacterium]
MTRPDFIRVVLTITAVAAGGCLRPGFTATEEADKSNTTVYYVCADGADANPGTREQPFATLERARDAIRELKTQSGGMPDGGVTVVLRGGVYSRTATFELTAEDSGTADAPVVYASAPKDGEEALLCGGLSFALTEFRVVDDAATLGRLPETARGKVLQFDLKAMGITEFGQMPLYGHSMHALSAYTRYQAGPPAPELFCNGKVMTLARWPNQDYAHITEVVEMGSVVRNWDDKLKGQILKFGAGAGTMAYIPPEQRPDPPHGFAIAIDSDRPLRWTAAEDPWMYGFWYWNWSDQEPGFVDPANGDFALRSDSVVYKLLPDFRPVHFDRMGLLDDQAQSHSAGTTEKPRCLRRSGKDARQ